MKVLEKNENGKWSEKELEIKKLTSYGKWFVMNQANQKPKEKVNGQWR